VTAYSVLHGFSRTEVSWLHLKVTAVVVVVVVGGMVSEKEQNRPFF